MKAFSSRAARSLELEARRDGVGTLLCGGRAACGAWLLIQPLKHLGLVQDPSGRACYQLFYALHFYLRLAWLAVTGRDFFDRPTTARRRVAKLVVSCAVGAAAVALGRRTGWHHGAATAVSRALPNGLAVGVLVAKTTTSVFDFLASEVRERIHVVRATREILSPRHFLPDLLPEASTDHERRALGEAADAARAAIARQIRHEASAAQDDARRTRAQRVHLQLARVAIAVATTAVGLYAASDGAIAVLPVGSRLFPLDRLPPPEQVAVYAPAVLGAFEVAHAVDEALYLNQYLVERAKLKLLSFGLRRINAPVVLVVRVLQSLTSLISAAVKVGGRLVLKVESLVFGEELFLYKFFQGHPRLQRAWRATAAAERALVDAGALYRRTVKFLERQTKAFLRKTHKDLWPWVVGFAGYRVQVGSLRLVDVPGYLSRKASEPVLLISTVAARAAGTLLRALANSSLAPVAALLRRGLKSDFAAAS